MSESQTKAMGKLPRTHQNCKENAGVARPGKTKHDHWKRGQ